MLSLWPPCWSTHSCATGARHVRSHTHKHFFGVQVAQDPNSRIAQAQGIVFFTDISSALAFSRDVKLFYIWVPKDYRRSGYVKEGTKRVAATG